MDVAGSFSRTAWWESHTLRPISHIWPQQTLTPPSLHHSSRSIGPPLLVSSEHTGQAPTWNTRQVQMYCNMAILAGGKFHENVAETFQVGVIFTLLLIFPWLIYMNFNLTQRKFSQRRQYCEIHEKLSLCKNFHFKFTVDDNGMATHESSEFWASCWFSRSITCWEHVNTNISNVWTDLHTNCQNCFAIYRIWKNQGVFVKHCPSGNKVLKAIFHFKVKVKVIDLGIISGVSMPNMKSLSLTVQKL